MDEDKVTEYFTSKMLKEKDFSKFSFKSGMRKTISGMFDTVVVPWMKTCLVKYTPDDFHARMRSNTYEFDGNRYTGFDFVGDWEVHHRKKINVMKGVSKTVRNYLDFDVDKILETIVEFMNTNGYILDNQEKVCIKHTIIKTQRIIFQSNRSK